MKRYASHYLYIPGIGFLKQYVVELNEGWVVNLFPLTEEIESVEWMPGVIVLSTEQDIDRNVKELNASGKCSTLSYSISSMMETNILASRLHSYLLYSFDFTAMQPVAETRRIQLR